MKTYELILADPPWWFKNWSADEPGKIHNRARGAAKHYPCMKTDAICALKPPAAKNCLLLIWTFGSHLEETFRVIHEWGFTYKTKAWTWIKLTKSGKPRPGQGYHTRHATEDCLLATRGTVGRPAVKNELDVIFAPFDPVHSRKPAEQYRKIDAMYPDKWPRLEMFAREAQPGWDVFGNEVDNSLVIEPSPIQLSFVEV